MIEENCRQIVNPLLHWYDTHKRELPWRDKNNAYYTWVSEIMLQQTRVEAVKPYFARFIKQLPDIKALAECPEEKLLKLWEGLGYYNRVRNMQIAAQEIMEQYNGMLPADCLQLKTLKGIGNYTAGAIASIAFGLGVPAVDGNVLRVISRIADFREDIMKQSSKNKMEELLAKVIPVERPGDFNQALMELGAVVCIPNGTPDCETCPVKACCSAYANDCVDELPIKSKKKPRKIQEKTVLVIQDGEHTALRKRQKRGLLAGLYELPNLDGHLSQEQVTQWAKEQNLDPVRVLPLADAKHIFSHVEWRMIGYQVKVAALDKHTLQDMIFILKEDAIDKYPIPSAFDAYSGCIKEEIKK